jgi:simple sugar transport system ATP-binding protein
VENAGRDAMHQLTVLSLREISKSFDGIDALKSVSLDLYPGEILGLVGDNGAGKSTLIKILSGVYPPDAGQLIIDGRNVDLKRYSVRKARKLGIETVYQKRSLGEKQSLWRNIFVGRPITNRFGFIKLQKQKQDTLEILKNHVGLQGAGINADACVRNLSGGERQGLAIGRAMYFDSKIIVLDEPTTALSLNEADKVMKFVSQFVSRNKSCIYISHNMNHVHCVAHRIVIMDRGKIVRECLKEKMTLEGLGTNLMRIATSTCLEH